MTYVGDRNGVAGVEVVVTDILQHVLNEHRTLSNNAIYHLQQLASIWKTRLAASGKVSRGGMQSNEPWRRVRLAVCGRGLRTNFDDGVIVGGQPDLGRSSVGHDDFDRVIKAGMGDVR